LNSSLTITESRLTIAVEMSGIVIAGTASGVGKTLVTLGLISVFRRKGLKVQPFKVGPDFIDPGYHTLASGLSSRNLDGWMLSTDRVQETFLKHTRQSDLAIVEGVMGLFDGSDGKSEKGSTAQIAKLLDLPVILVVDARSMARSVGAVVYGFEQYDPKINVAGVIFNRVGSSKHYEYLHDAVTVRCSAKVLGYLSRHEALQLPERHLGLVTAGEFGLPKNLMNHLIHEVESHVKIDEILLTAKRHSFAKNLGSGISAIPAQILSKPVFPAVRLAVASDDAFSFYYPDNLDLLSELGVDLCYFSPMRDISLPEGIHGIYLGGGYPEIYAGALAANQAIRKEIRQAAEEGLPIYAECGGLMYLTRAIQDPDGRAHEMVGLFPTEARMLKKRKALGYVEVRLAQDCLLGRAGWTIRGHEYHYSELTSDLLHQNIHGVYELLVRNENAPRKEGYQYRNVLASYVHLHFGSNPNVAQSIADHLRKRKGISYRS
jgi:cobyrinic acid a,c-diamide synthase